METSSTMVSPTKVAQEEGEDAKKCTVRRVAEYLPPRSVLRTGNKKANEGYFASIWSANTGGFLVLADSMIKGDESKGVVQGARDNLINECTNMGLISALMLTMILPMAYDHVNDWLEEDYPGSGFIFLDSYIGQQLGEAQVHAASPTLNDFVLVFYVIGFAGYLFSTIMTVIMLLCVGEVQTEMGCHVYLKNIGFMSRMPYLCFLMGCLFAVASALRFMVTPKTPGGLVALGLVCLFLVMGMFFGAPVLIQAAIKAHNTIHEYEDLRLSLSEAEEDVECWFSHNPDGGPLRDCLQELGCFVQHQNRSCDVILPLDSISEHRVAYYFHKKQAETLGITLSPMDLYRLATEPAK